MMHLTSVRTLFGTYLGAQPADKAAYIAKMAALNPTLSMPYPTAEALLFQFSRSDEYVPISRAQPSDSRCATRSYIVKGYPPTVVESHRVWPWPSSQKCIQRNRMGYHSATSAIVNDIRANELKPWRLWNIASGRAAIEK